MSDEVPMPEPESSVPIFGRVLTAMITPFNASGELNLAEAARLASYLVDEQRNDALVINGTTGESPTTSDAEKAALVERVVAEVGDRASVLAGVGTFATSHSIELAKQAEAVGADGLLVVTPYYSKPPQQALEDHFVSVADATSLPVMLYDIPKRTGTEIPEASLIRLSDHPNIRAVKDAKGDFSSSSAVIANSTLTYYAGDDANLLPLLAVGGAGVVGTSTPFSGKLAAEIISAFLAGGTALAQARNANALPIFRGVFASQGCMMVKAALNARGWQVGQCRPPMGTVPAPVLAEFLEVLDRGLN